MLRCTASAQAPNFGPLKQLAAQVRDSESNGDAMATSRSSPSPCWTSCSPPPRPGMRAIGLSETFMTELLDSAETLTGIAEEHGARTPWRT